MLNDLRERILGLRKKPVELGLIIGAFVILLLSILGAPSFEEWRTFTVLGIAFGCVYAIAATGIVLTYTTTGVFNFAHGAVGMAAAYLYFWLRVKQDLPAPMALILALAVFAPLMGLLIELVMRRFKDAAAGATLVVTIALTILLIGVVQTIFPNTGEGRGVPYLFGNRNMSIFGASLKWDEAGWLVVAIGVAIGLRALLYRSRTGVAMRAVVDNATLAGLNGAPPIRIARYSWMLGSFLAALAVLLYAPRQSPLDQVEVTFFILSAYGAAVFGRLKSLPLTFAGGIALALMQNYAQLDFPNQFPGNAGLGRITLALPGIFLFGSLLLLPEAKLTVGRIVGRRAPRIPKFTDSVARAIIFVPIVALLAFSGPSKYLPDMTRGLIYAVLLLSLVVLTGLSGQISLCQYVFAALGAWAMGKTAGGDSLLGLAAATMVAVPVGVLVALPAIRLQGLYLALVTFGFAVVSQSLIFEDPHIFGEGNVAVGRLNLLGLDFSKNEMFMILCAIVFALVAIGVLALKRGPFGRRLAAMRDSQAACATLGLDVRREKLTVFAISAGIAGLAGALFGGLNATAGSIQFDRINNIVLFLFAVVGGITTVSGAFIGGALFALLPLVQAEQPKAAGLVFAGVAVAAIGLGRQPNGIAGMLYEKFPTLARTPRRVVTEGPALEGASLAPQT